MNPVALACALALLAGPAAKPATPVATAAEADDMTTGKTGYYDFTTPTTWRRSDPPVMTKHELTWEIPAKGDDPAVPLVHRRLSDVAGALDAWKKRGVTVTERTQPIPGSDATAKVYLADQVKDGRAFLGAIVDLSAVDARTDGAYMRVNGGLFELEGPEGRVLAAKSDFDSLVRSVGLRQLTD